MAVFVAPFPATGVVRGDTDINVVLPDPPYSPGGPIIRPGVARHAGATVSLLPLAASNGTFPLLAPVTGLVRRIDITTPLPGLPAVTTLLEVAPLPFAASSVLRLLPGLPTFVLAVAPLTTNVLPEDDSLVKRGSELAMVSAAHVGLLFDDRVAVAPAVWVAAIATAMETADPDGDIGDWRRFEPLLPPGRRLRLLDHVGRPAASYRVRVGTDELSADAHGEVLLQPGEVDISWLSDAGGQPVRGPVHARYDGVPVDPTDDSASTQPGQPLTLPAAATHPNVQLLDTPAWFAARPPGLDPGLGHLHPDSRLEPLVDGIAALTPLLADLRAATGPGFGAHFAGWVFKDFPLDPGDPDGSMFVGLVAAMQGGVGARFLMDKYFVLRDDAPTDQMKLAALLLVMAGAEATLFASVLKDLETDELGFVALVSLPVLATVVLSLLDVGGMITDLLKLDGSKELFEVLESLSPGIALRARHPARFEDLSVQVPNIPPFNAATFLEGTGSHHQKFQVIRRTADTHGNRLIGYLGGIDLNSNRLDTPGHHGHSYQPPDSHAPAPSPAAFHDVHARLTGPAAADLALTFQRRWEFDITRQSAPPDEQLDPAFPAPDPGDADEVPPQEARHLVQVCRTGFASGAPGATMLPWSPQGEATIAEAILHAIEQAREYIYIEDQYFTPHDPYITALLDAAARKPKLRLVIVIPTGSDQLFGDIRRREIFERLREDPDDPDSPRAWGSRMVVAAPLRRPVLANAGRIASRGRLRMFTILSESGNIVVLGPRSRLPSGVPFWLWVNGEKMLAFEQGDDVNVGDIPARRYLVLRPTGGKPLWGSHRRSHPMNAAVTLAQDHGIYVHTKAIIVDDVFVGIGSCNTNRRGFFHDTEIAAFAVPERLKSAVDNPALALRTALWAEHLGIPPTMGRALLADPVAAFDLFRRSTLGGNRLSSFAALGITPELGFPGEASTPEKMLTTFGLNLAEDLVPYIWNTLIDPTTATDPFPRRGPELDSV